MFRGLSEKKFCTNYKNSFFQEHQWACAIHLFFLDCKMSNKNLTFCFFASSKIQTLCTSFLLPGTWIFSNYSRSFLSLFPPASQNTEAAFEKCSTKVVVQQNDVTKHSSSAQVVKSRKVLHANLLKTELHHKYFPKNLTSYLEQRYWEIHLDGYFCFTIIFSKHSLMAVPPR